MPVVLDNDAAHTHAKVQAWPVRHPRVQLHFTPTYRSWLNLVEVFLAIIEHQALRRGDFASVEELMAAIRRFCDGWNQRCRLFTWTRTPTRSWPSSTACCRKGLPRLLRPASWSAEWPGVGFAGRAVRPWESIGADSEAAVAAVQAAVGAGAGRLRV
jgi:hypothetical protein